MQTCPSTTVLWVSTALSLAGCTGPVPIGGPLLTIPPTTDARPWRLAADWQPGGPAGAALRAAGIEHVLTHGTERNARDSARGNPVSTAQAAEPRALTADAESERAWRKFCHHRLDLSAADRHRLHTTPLPAWALAHCNPTELGK